MQEPEVRKAQRDQAMRGQKAKKVKSSSQMLLRQRQKPKIVKHTKVGKTFSEPKKLEKKMSESTQQ